MLKDRFADFNDFAFLDLGNPLLFSSWQRKVPADKLQLLQSKYGPLFDIQSLESQLLFLYEDKDFHMENPPDILQYIYQFGLQYSIPEVVQLLKLNSVIAMTTASVERSFSCLKRVKTYLRNKMGHERLGCLYRSSVHKDMLKKLEE